MAEQMGFVTGMHFVIVYYSIAVNARERNMIIISKEMYEGHLESTWHGLFLSNRYRNPSMFGIIINTYLSSGQRAANSLKLLMW